LRGLGHVFIVLFMTHQLVNLANAAGVYVSN